MRVEEENEYFEIYGAATAFINMKGNKIKQEYDESQNTFKFVLQLHLIVCF